MVHRRSQVGGGIGRTVGDAAAFYPMQRFLADFGAGGGKRESDTAFSFAIPHRARHRKVLQQED
jgi:hypothetical protein